MLLGLPGLAGLLKIWLRLGELSWLLVLLVVAVLVVLLMLVLTGLVRLFLLWLLESACWLLAVGDAGFSLIVPSFDVAIFCVLLLVSSMLFMIGIRLNAFPWFWF